jgi:PAS domain S-box
MGTMMNADSKPRILIIDDEFINIKILHQTLEADYEVVFAKNGFDGLKIATADILPDLILLDIVMPGMDGYEVCQKLKEDDLTKNIPIIFITIKGEEEYENRGFEVGAVDYIAKPFSPNIVKRRVKTHISLKFAMEKMALQNIELLALNRDLEEKVASRTIHLERTNRALRESEERYRAISEYSQIAICIVNEQGKLMWANGEMVKQGGYSLDQLYEAESPISFLASESIEPILSNFKNFLAGPSYEHHLYFSFIHENGEKRLGECFLTDYRDANNGRNLIFCLTDITERALAEEELKRYSRELEEANTALRVVMSRKNEDQKVLEERLQQNIKDLVVPYVRKLKGANLNSNHKNYLDILESNLENVLTPFISNLSAIYRNMTPQEIQIIDMIRQGKNSKEIADMLNASVLTIQHSIEII